MKKVKLDLDQLNVESFSTTPRNAPKWGTVRGHGCSGNEPSLAEPDTASAMEHCPCIVPVTGDVVACATQCADLCFVEFTESCGMESCGPAMCA